MIRREIWIGETCGGWIGLLGWGWDRAEKGLKRA